MRERDALERADEPAESGALEPEDEGERQQGGVQEQPAESGGLEDEDEGAPWSE